MGESFQDSPEFRILRLTVMKVSLKILNKTNEPGHVISNNVAFRQVKTLTSLCSLLLSLETPNNVHSVA